MFNPVNIVKLMDSSLKSFSTQVLLVQSTANSIVMQPQVDFSGDSLFLKYSVEINDNLRTIQNFSDNYFNIMLPDLIQSISNLHNYFILYDSLTKVWVNHLSVDQLVSSLEILKSTASVYHSEMTRVVASLRNSLRVLSKDCSVFFETIRAFNNYLNGDNGVLSSLDDKIEQLLYVNTLGQNIAFFFTGSVSFIGLITIVVGVLTKVPINAEASLKMEIVGSVFFFPGAIGAAVTSSMYTRDYFEVYDLVIRKKELSNEVKCAYCLGVAIKKLSKYFLSLISAANEMEKSWHLLCRHLTQLISDLRDQKLPADYVRYIFISTRTSANSVFSSVNSIHALMSGVQVIKAKPHQKISEIFGGDHKALAV